MCLENYGIDTAHYYSGMAWDAALKMKKVNLELFMDEEMYNFVERSIRQISKRYAEVNNKKCRNYNPMKPITHLIFFDANNLYGYATANNWLQMDICC